MGSLTRVNSQIARTYNNCRFCGAVSLLGACNLRFLSVVSVLDSHERVGILSLVAISLADRAPVSIADRHGAAVAICRVPSMSRVTVCR